MAALLAREPAVAVRAQPPDHAAKYAGATTGKKRGYATGKRPQDVIRDSILGEPSSRSVVVVLCRLAVRSGLLDLKGGPRSPLSQSLSALLARRGVRVHAVLLGPVDTDMSRGLDIPKASPKSVGRAIFDGVEKGEEDVFPDPCQSPWRRTVRSSASMRRS